MPRNAAVRAWREIASLTLLCAALLSPLVLMVRLAAPPHAPAPAKPLWIPASRFIPTSFVPEIAGTSEHFVAIHDSTPAPMTPPVVILNLNNGQVVRRLQADRPEGARIRLLSFSKDEKRLYVLWSVDAKPRYTCADCYEWRSARRLSRVTFALYGETGSFYPEKSVDINVDSEETGSCNTLYVHNSRTGHLLAKRTLEDVSNISWANCSQDATTIAVNSGTRVQLLDSKTLRTRATYEHPEAVTITHTWPGNRFAVVDPHGMTLISGTDGHILHRYEAGKLSDRIPAPQFTAFESTPDGKLVFGMDSNRIYVWRQGVQEPPLTLRGNGSGSAFAFRTAGDGKYLMVPETIPSTPGLRIWDVRLLQIGQTT